MASQTREINTLQTALNTYHDTIKQISLETLQNAKTSSLTHSSKDLKEYTLAWIENLIQLIKQLNSYYFFNDKARDAALKTILEKFTQSSGNNAEFIRNIIADNELDSIQSSLDDYAKNINIAQYMHYALWIIATACFVTCLCMASIEAFWALLAVSIVTALICLISADKKYVFTPLENKFVRQPIEAAITTLSGFNQPLTAGASESAPSDDDSSSSHFTKSIMAGKFFNDKCYKLSEGEGNVSMSELIAAQPQPTKL